MLFFTCFLLKAHNVQSGIWANRFKKLHILNRRGEYKIALHKNKRFLRKARKKFGKEHPCTGKLYLTEAKTRVLLGRFKKYDSLIKTGLQFLKKTDSASTILSGYVMAADAYLEYGIPYKAEQTLHKAQKYYSRAGREHTRKQFQRLKARTLSALGYYKQADSLFQSLLPYYESRISRKNVDRWHYFYRKRRYADLQNQRARTLMNRGAYRKSDSLLTQNANWIKSTMHPQDIAYTDNLILQARLHSIFRRHNKAGVLLEKAKEQAKRVQYGLKYLENSKPHVNLYEQLIRNNEKQGKYLSANRTLKILDVKTVRYYGENSVYFARKNILDTKRQIRKGNLKKAENILESTLKIPKLPDAHPIRAKVYRLYYKMLVRRGAKDKAQKYLDSLLSIEKQLYGPNAPLYHRKKLERADFLANFQSKFQEALQIYRASYDSVYSPHVTAWQIETFSITNNLASLLEKLNRYDSAQAIYRKNIREAGNHLGQKSLVYAFQRAQLSNILITKGTYKAAKDTLTNALKAFDLSKNKHTREHGRSMEILGRYYYLTGAYSKAEDTWSEAAKIISQANQTNLTPYPPIDERALLYIKTGEYSESNTFLQKSLNLKEKRYGKTNYSLVKPLMYMASLNIITGDYNEADNYLHRAGTICSETFGKNSLQYSNLLHYYGEFYTAVGDYEKAGSTYEEVINKKQKHLGKDHIEIARTLKELALAEYFNKKAFDTVEKHLKTSATILKKELGDKNPLYASSLMNLAFFYIETKKTGKAEKLVDKAETIWNERLGSNFLFGTNIKTPEIHALRGDISYTRKNFQEAINHYEKSRRHYEKNYSNNHPEYVNVLSKLARAYYASGATEATISTLNQTTKIYLNYINRYFPALSRREKDKFWNLIKTDFELYKTLVLRHHKERPELLSKAYNFTLSTKALLLNSSRKIRENILNSKDSILKATYRAWIQKKEKLTRIVSMSKKQKAQKDIDQEALEKEISDLEKQLSEKSQAFKEGFGRTQHTWKDVRSSLKDQEMAMEIIRFRYFDQKFTDSIVYAALTITPNTKEHPRFTLIGDGNNLEGRQLKFYRNAMKFNISNNISYNTYWKPLNKITSGYKKIFVSPDGVYNQLNPETLQTPDNNYLLEHYNIIPISNTRDLITTRKDNSSPGINKTAALFGNPSFYSFQYKQDTIINITYDTSYVKVPDSSFYKTSMDSVSADSITSYSEIPHRDSAVIHADTTRTIRKKKVYASGTPDPGETLFNPLPGAEKEVKELHDLLEQKNWQARYFLGDSATEQRVKQQKTPGIFHIATHGFFAEQKEGYLETNFSAFNKSSILQSPLLRSGLVLSSGGDLLLQNSGGFNRKDGILTAYEAMNLRLDKTELVVLSACETGRGKVKIGEGVYGLQRAFLVAGADHVIMSLFKVSDKVTRELMVNFYSNWLETGSKRKAFRKAKQSIKQKYDNPRYWGAFVMIGV